MQYGNDHNLKIATLQSFAIISMPLVVALVGSVNLV
jgi:hypothetical protein